MRPCESRGTRSRSSRRRCDSRRPWAIAIVVGSLVVARGARADETAPAEDADPAALFRAANGALGGDRPGEAIAKLEALADRGVAQSPSERSRARPLHRRQALDRA